MTAPIAETTIAGYYVCIEDLGADGGRQAFVSKGRYSANLWTMEDLGELADANGNTKAVPPGIIGDLVNWAYQNGL